MKGTLLKPHLRILFMYFQMHSSKINHCIEHWGRFFRNHKKKTNLKVLFALFERHHSVWGHEHWKTRTSKHINANQATLHVLAETWFLLFMSTNSQRRSLWRKLQTKKIHRNWNFRQESSRWADQMTVRTTLALFSQQEPTKSILNSSCTDL